MAAEPDWRPAGDVARLVRAGELSAAETVAAAIERAEHAQPSLNAVAVPLYERAVDDACRFDADRSASRPLAGVPVTVKESYEVTGTPASAGVEALAEVRSRRDADVVTALRAAGAVIIAKANLAQLMWFAETDNPVYGRTSNPWALERSPGGSSGGDAALVAAGVVPVAVGSDLGGSVRQPAHCCGIAALKPTAGRLSLSGTLDERLYAGFGWIPNQPGIFARDPDDIEIVLRALDSGALRRGVPPLTPATPSGIRVGVFWDNGVYAPSPTVRRAVDLAVAAAERAGALVVPFAPPATDLALDLFEAVFRSDGGEALRRLLNGGTAHPRVAAALGAARGHAVDAAGGEVLEARIAEYRRTFALALDGQALDAVICPVYPVPAVLHGGSGDVVRGQSYSSIWNLLGYPAGVVPVTTVAESEDRGAAGLPVGVQIAARPWREDAVIGLMRAVGDSTLPSVEGPATLGNSRIWYGRSVAHRVRRR
jgi:Asp-tRNA(Asn)/Glu-tRNA(Gln) amidotransferase A subunit family amidase